MSAYQACELRLFLGDAVEGPPPERGRVVLELAQVSAIGIGIGRLSGEPSSEQTLAAALDRGCLLVDLGRPAGEHAEAAELGVGRVLARRLDPVVVLATATDLSPGAVVRRVRVTAARVRRDRLDVLLLEAGPDDDLLAAFAVCEQLADRGELGGYGVRLRGVEAGSGEQLVGHLVDLAGRARRWPRLVAVQVPCAAVPAGSGPDVVAAAHRHGLRVVGCELAGVPGPAGSDAAASACRCALDAGADHVVLDAGAVNQVDAVRSLLPLGLAA